MNTLMSVSEWIVIEVNIEKGRYIYVYIHMKERENRLMQWQR